MKRRIATIVEGHGEVGALPVLIRRIAANYLPDIRVEINEKSWRISRGTLLKNDVEIKRALDTLALSVKGTGGILVLFDGDDDCPAQIAPVQLKRIANMRRDIPISVVVANREYEAWFLAAATSLAGYEGLPLLLENHPNPELTRDCKGWLSKNMPEKFGYRETLHQEKFSGLIDIAIARERSDSFDKLCREVIRLVQP
jgi:Domain of unknown function (DUF4276)